MEYICSGAAVKTYTKYTPLLREPIPACSTADANQKNRLFLCLVHTVHTGRGIIKLAWGMNVESYQGRLCVSLQRLRATAVENGKPASAKPISYKTIRTVPSE